MPFLVDVQLAWPSSALVSVLKPLLDGIVSALHVQDDSRLGEVVSRIAVRHADPAKIAR